MGNTQSAVCRLIHCISNDISVVADRIGSTPQNVYKWENGISKPDGEHLLTLIRVAYKCNPKQVLSELEGQ